MIQKMTLWNRDMPKLSNEERSAFILLHRPEQIPADLNIFKLLEEFAQFMPLGSAYHKHVSRDNQVFRKLKEKHDKLSVEYIEGARNLINKIIRHLNNDSIEYRLHNIRNTRHIVAHYFKQSASGWTIDTVAESLEQTDAELGITAQEILAAKDFKGCIPARAKALATALSLLELAPKPVPKQAVIAQLEAHPRQHVEEMVEAPTPEKLIKETQTTRIGLALGLLKAYQAKLLNEKTSSWAVRFFGHGSRNAEKLAYTSAMITELETIKEDINAEGMIDLSKKINEAHDKVMREFQGDANKITKGGRIFGTSRLLSLQRLLNINSAWGAHKQPCYWSNEDFGGLQRSGMSGHDSQNVVQQFYQCEVLQHQGQFQLKYAGVEGAFNAFRHKTLPETIFEGEDGYQPPSSTY